MDEPSHKPRPLAYYRSVLAKGNGTQWRALLQLCRENYDIAFQVARAVSSLDENKFSTLRRLWKHAIECHQPGIDIRMGKSLDEDLKVRKLKAQKYSDVGGE